MLTCYEVRFHDFHENVNHLRSSGTILNPCKLREMDMVVKRVVSYVVRSSCLDFDTRLHTSQSLLSTSQFFRLLEKVTGFTDPIPSDNINTFSQPFAHLLSLSLLSLMYGFLDPPCESLQFDQ